MSSTVIITGGGRATLRRIDEQQSKAYTGFTAVRAQEYNDLLTELENMADRDGCPADPCPES